MRGDKMKKFILGLMSILFSITNVQAEIYHGIDIDKVYSQSDWSSKDKIKEAIDDYTLLCLYQTELDGCLEQNEKRLFCYNKVADKILKNFYVYPDNNIKIYNQFIQILSKAYSIQSCSNKYEWPSGNLCETANKSEVFKMVHSYIQDLINSCKEKMLFYLPEIKNYK